MSRNTDQRIADILQAVDRCRRYVDMLDGDDDADLLDMAENRLLSAPLALIET